MLLVVLISRVLSESFFLDPPGAVYRNPAPVLQEPQGRASQNAPWDEKVQTYLISSRSSLARFPVESAEVPGPMIWEHLHKIPQVGWRDDSAVRSTCNLADDLGFVPSTHMVIQGPL